MGNLELVKRDHIYLLDWEAAKTAIAKCTQLDEVKDIRDRMEALRAYAKQAREGLEVQNSIAEIKLRAERRIGELSRALPTHEHRLNQAGHDDPPVTTKTEALKDIGIARRIACRYEAIADIPENAFEEAIKTVKNHNQELTTAGMYETARKLHHQKQIEQQKERLREIPVSDYVPVLKHGDFRELIKALPDNSIDLILTDPPYGKGYIHLLYDLAKEARRVLKTGRFLIFYYGNLYLLKATDSMLQYLEYYYSGFLYHKGAIKPDFSVNMWTRGKPILFFFKPPLKKQDTWIENVFISGAPNKILHAWGQSEPTFIKLIEAFTRPGDTVLDPMMGGGTTVSACVKTKRKSIGFEIDKKYFEIVQALYGKASSNKGAKAWVKS
ncbi:MAG: hypothetical protein M1381_11325 [Deltaproteobacteria bacterium]|nr:hypothetical protein [Deltaproteobacteria bacterium]